MLVTEGQRFVAFFDILGFSSWVEDSGSKEVFTYARGFLHLMVRASLPGSIVNPDMSVQIQESNIGYINFSDSVVFYSRDDSYECLSTMLSVCGEFMNNVICGPSRMLRGAIAHGEFYADPEENAYVGKALIDAYRLEALQDWLALGIHETVESVPAFHRALEENEGYIVRSLVPLKEKKDSKDSGRKPLCINWASKDFVQGSFNALRGLEDCYRRGMAALRQDPEEIEKLKRRIDHTREFLLYYNADLREQKVSTKNERDQAEDCAR